MRSEDLSTFSEMKRAASERKGKHGAVQSVWHEEVDHLMRGQLDNPFDEYVYVAEGCPEGKNELELVGVIELNQWRRVAVITDLLVSDQQRRHGIGKALVDHARQSVEKQNHTTIMATINERSRAQRFFRHVGFRDVQQCTIVARLKLPLKDSPG
jgi:N-acetylglutamate synthase-like GNAT family acetyltransferase